MAQDRRVIMRTSVLPTARTAYAAVPGSLEEYDISKATYNKNTVSSSIGRLGGNSTLTDITSAQWGDGWSSMISERATWDSLRVGARASIEIFPKLSIKTRLMFVPWTHYELEDIHYMRSSHKKDPSFEAKADGGFGVMSDTTISYNIWKGLSIEAGYPQGISI